MRDNHEQKFERLYRKTDALEKVISAALNPEGQSETFGYFLITMMPIPGGGTEFVVRTNANHEDMDTALIEMISHRRKAKEGASPPKIQ